MQVFKVVVRIAIVLAVVVSVGVAWFWHSMSEIPDMCGNEIISEHPSPDGLRKVVVFERSCGATTGFSTQVSIIPAHMQLPDEAGNLFIADTDHGTAPSGPAGGPTVRVRWDGAQLVVLAHHPRARVFEANAEAGGVRARYVAAP